MKCMFFHKDCNCLEERIECPHAKNTEHVVNVVNYMLEIAGLPSYSLLQRSCEEATKFVLSLTKEPRTEQKEEWICGHCGKNKDNEGGICPHCFKFPTIYAPSKLRTGCSEAQQLKPLPEVYDHIHFPDSPQKTALTLLRPQPNENISQWAERYVSTMLSE